MTSAIQLKAALRRQLREAGRLVGEGDAKKFGDKLCERLSEQSVWNEATHILFFSPLPGEPDITPLWKQAEAEGKEVFLPRYEPLQNQYLPCPVKSSENLFPGKFNILEPISAAGVADLNQLDLLLVPGVAFDPRGHRLGRGKGFYDRLLALARGHKCGIAFDWQIVNEVPVEPHDVRLDSVVTPTRWLTFRAGLN